MTTFTVNVPGKAKNKLAKFIKELGGEIIHITEPDNRKGALLNGLEESLNQVKQIREGKLPRLSLKESLGD